MACNCGKSRSLHNRQTAGGMGVGQRIPIKPLRQLTPSQLDNIENQKRLSAAKVIANTGGNTPDRRMMERRRRDILASRLGK